MRFVGNLRRDFAHVSKMHNIFLFVCSIGHNIYSLFNSIGQGIENCEAWDSQLGGDIPLQEDNPRLHRLRTPLELSAKAINQWFLTLLEVMNLTSSVHTFIKPFVVGKTKCVSWFFFFSFIAQNLLPPNPWNWLPEPLGFDQTQVKNYWSKC